MAVRRRRGLTQHHVLRVMHALTRYLDLLVSQMEADAAVLSTGWVYWTVVPFVLYFVYCLLKWWILLAPITVPLTILRWNGAAFELKKFEAWLRRN